MRDAAGARAGWDGSKSRSPDPDDERGRGPGSSRVLPPRRARPSVVLLTIAGAVLVATGLSAVGTEPASITDPGAAALASRSPTPGTTGLATTAPATATLSSNSIASKPPADASAPPAAAATSAPKPTPKVTPRPTPRSTPRPPLAPPPPRAASSYLLMSPSELRKLPTSGAAWNWVVEVSKRSATPRLSSNDTHADQIVLARALVYGRTGDAAMRVSVLDALKAVVGTESGGQTLALGRNLPGYVIAADLIDVRSADPAFDKDVFRPWLKKLLTKVLDGDTLVGTAEKRPNNWGTHAGAARVAIARYLGDTAQLNRQAKVFRGWLGDRGSYAGFKYGSLSWQCDAAKPVGINPAGCTRDGHELGGVLPDDQRRGGNYTWPPPKENYVWEALQGAVLQAELLYQAGHAAWSWEDAALGRAVRWLVDVAKYPATGDDRWQPWLTDARYGTSDRGGTAKTLGKNFSFADWLYAR